MSDLSLPFWIMLDEDRAHPPSAFTTRDKLEAFLEGQRLVRWKMSFVSDREALILSIADIHQQGAATVRL